MDNKPVAWIAVGNNTNVFFDLDTALSIDDNPTPLYTHPVKELTDKEILEVHINTPFIDGYLNKNLIEFARAILRKAQENG
jgi:hypothetical protein